MIYSENPYKIDGKDEIIIGYPLKENLNAIFVDRKQFAQEMSDLVEYYVERTEEIVEKYFNSKKK